MVSVKLHESQFGVAWKMVILLDSGSKVWLTVPNSVNEPQELRDKRVKVTATFTPSNDDPTFAFGKRPSKFEVI